MFMFNNNPLENKTKQKKTNTTKTHALGHALQTMMVVIVVQSRSCSFNITFQNDKNMSCL